MRCLLALLVPGGLVMFVAGVLHLAKRRVCPPGTATLVNDMCQDERGKVFPKNTTTEPVPEIGIPLTVIGLLIALSGLSLLSYWLRRRDDDYNNNE